MHVFIIFDTLTLNLDNRGIESIKMTTPNPDYKPDWEEFHDRHNEGRKLTKEKIHELYQRDYELDEAGKRYGSPERQKIHEQTKALQAEYDTHHEQCKHCLSNYQHETIGDAARYVFEEFPPYMHKRGPIAVPRINYDKFKTMEEIRNAWEQTLSILNQREAEATLSLPTGRPDGLDVFEKTSSNNVTSAIQIFDESELYSDTFQDAIPSGCRVLVTIDRRKDGKFHICFSQDSAMAQEYEHTGMWLQHEIGALATAMYNRIRESKMAPPQQKPSPGNSTASTKWDLNNVVSITAAQKSAIDPGEFKFYIHHPPEHLREELFYSVDMVIDMPFENGRFQNPNFHGYDVVPKTVQDAFKATRAATPSVVAHPAFE